MKYFCHTGITAIQELQRSFVRKFVIQSLHLYKLSRTKYYSQTMALRLRYSDCFINNSRDHYSFIIHSTKGGVLRSVGKS